MYEVIDNTVALNRLTVIGLFVTYLFPVLVSIVGLHCCYFYKLFCKKDYRNMYVMVT